MWLVTMHEFVEIVDKLESCLVGSFVEVEVGREWRSKEAGSIGARLVGKKKELSENGVGKCDYVTRQTGMLRVCCWVLILWGQLCDNFGHVSQAVLRGDYDGRVCGAVSEVIRGIKGCQIVMSFKILQITEIKNYLLQLFYRNSL